VERDRAARLERVIAAVQRRWGLPALRIFGKRHTEAVPVISTGCPELDAALQMGGFPHGQFTELFGMETWGKTTITLGALVQAQAQGERISYMDLPGTFDAEYAPGAVSALQRYC
jgi:recombination protein RecA